MRAKCFVVLLAAGVIPAFASADISYINWDKSSATATSVSGTLTLADNSTVNVTVSGGPINFVFGETDTNYWQPKETFQGTGVPNAPTNGFVGLAAGDASYTMTFDRPIHNVIFDLVSVGQSSIPVTYDFDHSFTIINQGQGPFGNGTLVQNGDAVTGTEGNGVLLFEGDLSSLSWSIDNAEYWHGFTAGVAGPAAVPEPASIAALGLGALGLLARKRKK